MIHASPELPNEIWAKIAMTGPRVYNLLVRAIPGLSRSCAVNTARELFCSTTVLYAASHNLADDVIMPTLGGKIHTNGEHVVTTTNRSSVITTIVNARYGRLVLSSSDRPSFRWLTKNYILDVYAKKGFLHRVGGQPAITINIAYDSMKRIWARNGVATHGLVIRERRFEFQDVLYIDFTHGMLKFKRAYSCKSLTTDSLDDIRPCFTLKPMSYDGSVMYDYRTRDIQRLAGECARDVRKVLEIARNISYLMDDLFSREPFEYPSLMVKS